ncbi:MAG: hypothetical protein ABEJ23_06665 [Haloarculaceae archaeon]
MTYTWQYYDVVLVAIFASLALGAAVGVVTSVPLPAAVVATGLVSAALIGHALFVNGPVDDPQDLAEPVDVLN